MKKNTLLLILACLSITIFSVSCKKESASSIAPADRLTGTFFVVESNDIDTITERYTATVTKTNDSTIKITSDLQNPPKFHLKQIFTKVRWESKILDNSPTTVRGTIKNENDFEILYAIGIGATVVSVKQQYNRK